MRRIDPSSLRFGIALGTCFAAPANADNAVSWRDCVGLAAAHNPSLAAVHARVEASEAGVGSARSGLFPQVAASASADRSGHDGEDTDTDTTSQASLGLEQTLYDGGKTRAAVRAATSTLAQTHAAGADTAAQVTYSLRTVFIRALHLQEQLRLLQTIEQRRRDNAELVELRYEGGREHRGSLASSLASLNEAEVQSRQADRKALAERASLGRSLGVSAWNPETPVVGSLCAEASDRQLDVEALARTTPAYRVALAQLDVVREQLVGTRAGGYPTVSLSGSVGRSGSDTALEDDSWNVGVKVSIPLWTGWKTRHEVHKAQATVREAEANAAAALDKAVRTLTDAHQTCLDAEDAVAVQGRYVEAAELRAEIARQQYEDGLLGFENWVVIEDELISRKKQLLDARHNAMAAEAAWWQATGYSAFGMAANGKDGQP